MTITAADADSNTASSDAGTLTFTVAVAGTTLASSPSPLTEGNLNGATLTVTLPSGVAFVGGVNPTSFALVTTPAIPGLSISGSGFSTRLRSGVASATLTLATGAGYGFNVPSTLAVRVAAAATTARGALTSAALAVSPTPGVTLSRRSGTRQRHLLERRHHGELRFELVTDIPGVSVDSVSSMSSGDFAGVETLVVKVLAAAHSTSEDLTTGARRVTPTPGTEPRDDAGSDNANPGGVLRPRALGRRRKRPTGSETDELDGRRHRRSAQVRTKADDGGPRLEAANRSDFLSHRRH